MTHTYRAKTDPIEAAHFTNEGDNAERIVAWVRDLGGQAQYHEHGTVTGQPLLVVGALSAAVGDYIIRGVLPRLFVVMPAEAFERDFERID